MASASVFETLEPSAAFPFVCNGCHEIFASRKFLKDHLWVCQDSSDSLKLVGGLCVQHPELIYCPREDIAHLEKDIHGTVCKKTSSSLVFQDVQWEMIWVRQIWVLCLGFGLGISMITDIITVLRFNYLTLQRRIGHSRPTERTDLLTNTLQKGAVSLGTPFLHLYLKYHSKFIHLPLAGYPI